MDKNKIRKLVKKELDKAKGKYKEDAELCGTKTALLTINKAEEQAKAIFKSIIDKYYEYPTRYYDRHGVGVGTKTGKNLYNANQIHFNNNLDNFSGEFGWDASGMEDYTSIVKNEYGEKVEVIRANKEDVLEDVMSGNRAFWLEKGLKYEYKDSYFDATGSPNEIQKQYVKEIGDIMRKMSTEVLEKEKLNKKYSWNK